MTRHQKIAAKAVANYLKEGSQSPVMLFDLSCLADQAAFACGRKTELFQSLFDYVDLLPADWKSTWLTAGGDSIYYAVPRNWKSGDSESQSLLLGPGSLRTADNPDD